MDDGPRASARALVIAAGLLVLMGAGCATANTTSNTVPRQTDQQSVDLLDQEKAIAQNELGKYVQKACSKEYDGTEFQLEPVERMFGEVRGFDDQQLKDLIRTSEQSEWLIEEVCGEKISVSTGGYEPVIYLAMSNSSSSEARIGFWNVGKGSIVLSDPMKVYGVGQTGAFVDFYLTRQRGAPPANKYSVVGITDNSGMYGQAQTMYQFNPETKKITQKDCTEDSCEKFY